MECKTAVSTRNASAALTYVLSRAVSFRKPAAVKRHQAAGTCAGHPPSFLKPPRKEWRAHRTDPSHSAAGRPGEPPARPTPSPPYPPRRDGSPRRGPRPLTPLPPPPAGWGWRAAGRDSQATGAVCRGRGSGGARREAPCPAWGEAKRSEARGGEKPGAGRARKKRGRTPENGPREGRRTGRAGRSGREQPRRTALHIPCPPPPPAPHCACVRPPPFPQAAAAHARREALAARGECCGWGREAVADRAVCGAAVPAVPRSFVCAAWGGVWDRSARQASGKALLSASSSVSPLLPPPKKVLAPDKFSSGWPASRGSTMPVLSECLQLVSQT